MQTIAVKQRLLSLDFFRGLTVAAMILVNNPGNWSYVYAPLEHSKWNGCTPTDLIFPFFLFIAGVAIPYALGSRKEDPGQHRALIWQALRRGATIIALGWFLNLFPKFNFAHLRFPGVLPRIGVVFSICAILFIKTSRRTQICTAAVLLLVYWVMMTCIPVPGIGAPNLEPETNLGAWLDRLVFTPAHLWSGSKTWDPEGILSTLPAIGTGIFGMLVGAWLRRKDKDDAVKVSWMFVYGFGSVVLALIWDPFFPINKSLWTGSFVLYTGGLATMALAASYWLIDVQGHQRYLAPFVAFGRNAITAFVLSGLVPKLLGYIPVRDTNLHEWFYQTVFVSWLSPYHASLGAAILLVLVILVPVAIMYRRNIIIKI
ncbi:acyltransferase family protein [Chitinophaga sp. RAB17]|uniref:acyltransferase family protein n=1 Tax=Chitinophaga sp. RAB17 TaxID=3233049 RepID=UPI003F9122CD